MGLDKVTKQPRETLRLGHEFKESMNTGDFISLVGSFTSSDAALTLADIVVSAGTQVSALVSGGVAGVDYKITALVTTSVSKEVLEHEFIVKVREL